MVRVHLQRQWVYLRWREVSAPQPERGLRTQLFLVSKVWLRKEEFLQDWRVLLKGVSQVTERQQLPALHKSLAQAAQIWLLACLKK